MNHVDGSWAGSGKLPSGVSAGELLQRGGALPLHVVLELPIPGFTVRSLLQLRPGSIVETSAQHNDDLVLQANGQLLALVKFDVTGNVLAVRLTEVL